MGWLDDIQVRPNLKPGNAFRARMSHHRYVYKLHILAEVESMIVYRWYGRHKQWWHYEIEHPKMLELMILKEEERQKKE